VFKSHSAPAFDVTAGFECDHVTCDQHIVAFGHQNRRFRVFQPNPVTSVVRQVSESSRFQDRRSGAPESSTRNTRFQHHRRCVDRITAR
jgi:hypothetical protein